MFYNANSFVNMTQLSFFQTHLKKQFYHMKIWLVVFLFLKSQKIFWCWWNIVQQIESYKDKDCRLILENLAW